MDLSIKDLIVKTERPAKGLQGLSPQVGIASSSDASAAAFNQLLNSFRPERAAPRAEDVRTNERKVDTHREARETRNADTQKDLRRADAPRSEATADSEDVAAPGQDSGNLGTPEDTTAAPAHPVAVAKVETASAGGVIGAHAERDRAPGGTPVKTFGLAAGGRNQPTETQPSSAVQQAKAAAAVTETPAAPTLAPLPASAAAKRPAVFRDLATMTTRVPPAGEPLNEESLARLAAALKPVPAASPAAQSSSPASASPDSALRNAFGPAARGESNIQLAETTRLQVMDLSQSDVAPLRSPMTPGLLALQEVAQVATLGQSGPAAAETVAQAKQSAAQATATGVPTVVPENMPVPATVPATSQFTDGEASSGPVRTPAPSLTAFATAPGTAGPGIIKSVHASVQQAARAPQTPAVPVDDVAVHIARAAANGADHINIKLKPAALGEVEVKLELTHDGRVAAVVTADRADTLDILARDAKALERALADAGLKADQGSLQFNLRGDGQNDDAARDGKGRADGGVPGGGADKGEPDGSNGIGTGYANARAASGGIDIRV